MEYHLDKAIELLAQTPKTLHTMLSGLSDDWIYCNEGEATWSAFDIVGHLIHGERTDWVTRLNIIIHNTNNGTFEPFDRFAQFEASKDKSMEELLVTFSELRHKNLEYLKALNLTDNQFSRTATHPSLGTVTLKNLLATWVVHDLGHMAQIARVMAKQYKDQIGPWTAYLPIVNH